MDEAVGQVGIIRDISRFGPYVDVEGVGEFFFPFFVLVKIDE